MKGAGCGGLVKFSMFRTVPYKVDESIGQVVESGENISYILAALNFCFRKYFNTSFKPYTYSVWLVNPFDRDDL